jgi:hypothetical protein
VADSTSADDSDTAEPSATIEAQDPVSRDLGELSDATIAVEYGDERRGVFG